MRCGEKKAHPRHEDVYSRPCAGVTPDDAIVYEIARIEMHPAILHAFYRQTVYPIGPWAGIATDADRPDLSAIIGLPVVVVPGKYSEPHTWRLIVASGVLESSDDGG